MPILIEEKRMALLGQADALEIHYFLIQEWAVVQRMEEVLVVDSIRREDGSEQDVVPAPSGRPIELPEPNFLSAAKSFPPKTTAPDPLVLRVRFLAHNTS